MYATLTSTEPPTPWASLAGRWATSTRRGMTWLATEITTSTPKTANDMTWVTPTLAAASVALSLALRRYRTFRATPPTAAGVTRITNDAATCTRKVRSVFSRSSTKPEIARVAPTYVAAEHASAIRLHSGFVCASSLENETLASWPASMYAAKTPAISVISVRGLTRSSRAGI